MPMAISSTVAFVQPALCWIASSSTKTTSIRRASSRPSVVLPAPLPPAIAIRFAVFIVEGVRLTVAFTRSPRRSRRRVGCRAGLGFVVAFQSYYYFCPGVSFRKILDGLNGLTQGINSFNQRLDFSGGQQLFEKIQLLVVHPRDRHQADGPSASL